MTVSQWGRNEWKFSKTEKEIKATCYVYWNTTDSNEVNVYTTQKNVINKPILSFFYYNIIMLSDLQYDSSCVISL